MADIVILGSGGFGLSIAVMCYNAGHSVTVWSKFQDEIDTIKRTGELKAKLSGVKIPKGITLTTDMSCVKNKNLVVIGIPAAFVRSVCEGRWQPAYKRIQCSLCRDWRTIGVNFGCFRRFYICRNGNK